MNQLDHETIPVEEDFQDSEIDLRQVFFTILKYKWSILALAITVSVLTSMWAYSLVDIYRGTSSLLIEAEESKIVSIEEVYGLSTDSWEYYETQLQILKSRALASKVFDALNLEKHAEFLPSTKPESRLPSFNIMGTIKKWIKNLLPDKLPGEDKPPVPMDANTRKNILVGGLMGGLDIELLRDTQIITISYDSEYPDLAASVPNALAEAYINSFLDADLEKTQQATRWITGRTGELRKKFEESERQLQAFIEAENMVDVESVNSLATKELGTLSSGLVEVRRQRSEAEALYQQVKSIKDGNSLEQLESLPAVLNHPLISSSYSSRAQAQRKVSELSKRYGPKHPKMIAVTAELKTTETDLRKQIENIAQSVAKDYEIARAKESHLSQAMNKTKNQVRDSSKMSYKLAALQREVETNRQLYEVFLTRFKETAATSDLQPVNARIIDLAIEPLSPYKPNRKRYVQIALMLSLMAGIGLALLIEYLDNTFKNSGTLEEKLKLPVLGVLPKLKNWGKDRNAMHLFIKDSTSGFAESVRTIRTGIMLSNIDIEQKVIVVTSSVPGEGKSLVSSNLAAAVAQMKKTLLIDADMRKPVVAPSYHLGKEAKGLSELVSMSAELSECIHKTDIELLDVLPSGKLPPNPLELLASNRFKLVIDTLKKHYEYIIIDSAPVVAVSDPRVLARIADGVVFVVKADATSHQLAKKGVKKLLELHAHIVGTVLNQVSPSKKSKYGDYDSNYYSYYGYSE
ncbi:MAG: lipopolysaccharide biosynthesis protein [Gammaproteobacteria bacterium]|nr:MAG: lipopolysaccharide biosynthesis protein [Gammaproteobacteria bacterium]RKZ71998.1 MAG: lipopolysaccharide biosynthesis protein [Gammaproteobacteria bacterium]